MFRRPTIHRRRNNLFVYDNSFRANESRAVRKETRRFGVSQFHWPKLLLKRTIITTLTIQFPHFTNKVLGVLSDFFGKTGIHGLAYLGDSKRSFWERWTYDPVHLFIWAFDILSLLIHFKRIWWAIAIALLISLCGFLGLKTWQVDGYDRIILRYAKEPSSIEIIPFPAVSICPVTKVSARKFNYTDVYRSLMKFDGEHSRLITPKE